MNIEMPKGAAKIIQTLEQAGYEAYIVGGCVRDALRGVTPADWDITTSAKPAEMKALFHHTIDTGIEHGTVTVRMYGESYEVTTFRVDGVYEDHRRPKDVTFTASLTEDLKRRDFTINAMAYNDTVGIVDLYGGKEDLERGIIRCVGVASERFDEDALRILRAVRFAAKLSTPDRCFVIEEDTAAAIRKQAHNLTAISAERIREELTKLITSDYPERLEDAYCYGITAYILPEFDVTMETEQNTPYHCYDVGHHILAVMQAVDNTPVLRYAALLHDIAKPACKTTDAKGQDHFYGHAAAGRDVAHKILRRLKMDNDTMRKVERLVEWHDYGLKGDITSKRLLRKGLHKMGEDLFADYAKLRYADILGQSAYNREKTLDSYYKILAMHEEIVAAGDALTIKDLAVGGKELMEIGMKPGKGLGLMLQELLERVLDNPEENTAKNLLAHARANLEAEREKYEG